MQGVRGLRARQPSSAHVQWPTAATAQRSRMPGTHWHCLPGRIAAPDAHRRMPLLPAPAPGALPTILSTPDRQLTGAKDHSIAAATPTAPDDRPGQHCGCRTTPACSARGGYQDQDNPMHRGRQKASGRRYPTVARMEAAASRHAGCNSARLQQQTLWPADALPLPPGKPRPADLCDHCIDAAS